MSESEAFRSEPVGSERFSAANKPECRAGENSVKTPSAAERPQVTYREFAERYAGMTFDGTERSPLWDKIVPQADLDLAAEGRRLSFALIEGDGDPTDVEAWGEVDH